MILDSSAVVEVILKLPRWEYILEKVIAAKGIGIGAPTLVESALVIGSRLARHPTQIVSDFIREAEIEVISFTSDHYPIALDAYERFGKGRHPAGLNFGDCLTYSICSYARDSLLFIGQDFIQTDIKVA